MTLRLTGLCLLFACSLVRAGDVKVVLDSLDGSTAFVVLDSQSNQLARVESGGVAIGGGKGNLASAAFSSVGAGVNNGVYAEFARIGGGANHVVDGYAGVIGGGGGLDGLTGTQAGNAVHGDFGTIGGGIGNTVATNAYYAVIAGGYYNATTGIGGTVAGGSLNSANGLYATVPGGIDNHADAAYAFAAGRGSMATNSGAWVWGDATPAYFRSTRNNEFRVRASGGVFFYSDTNAVVGVRLAPGGNGWSAVSDRDLKENFQPVNGGDVLDRLATLPVQSWNMKSQDPSIRHLGPTAQDFHAAFGLGETERHISYTDADGVALAALQALLARVQTAEARLDQALAEIARLKRAAPTSTSQESSP